ncbi:MAG: hypothetical protein A2992_06475 [Elusimicrobia bacterium RIFCSPLOWO2_01_FULL_59_12]|nr:MAG: hypothetical protein A2992_06475 [Elusimicrobia bacterium RIFCSPLOWO2_01_FULL_59_12]
MDGVYRFSFKDDILAREIEDSLFWAVFNAESVFGKAKVRLDASFYFDRRKKVCVIDKATEVGQHIAQLFTSLATRKFGEEGFKVERVEEKEPEDHGNSKS